MGHSRTQIRSSDCGAFALASESARNRAGGEYAPPCQICGRRVGSTSNPPPSATQVSAKASLTPSGLGWGLDGQALSSLAPPPLQHAPPSSGLHAREESVRSLPAQVAWLIRALHPLLFLS